MPYKSLREGFSMSVRNIFRVGPLAALVLGAILSCSMLSGYASAQSAEDKATKGVYGDWKLRCDSPPGSTNELCIIQQNVVDDQDPDTRLVVTVYKTADGKSRMMRIIAPLGVLLPSGLGVRIDQTDMGRVGFVRCLPSGCVAEVRLEDGLLEQLRTGQNITFIVFKNLEQGVGVPVSLSGFADAYDKLPNISF